MNSKLKEIFLMGFMWGIPFWLFISAIRWAENKPPAFGSLSIFLLISIIGGLCVGLISYKPNSNKIKRTTALLHKDLKCKAPLIEPNLRRNLGKWAT
ncbi:hypothetical protein [Acinetobacter lwoffii]|uniref:hypothetical protein n=1 Tax=Acinetobacter lwoffii TaxID=28090 RepID=UPI0021CD5506|nr:hypothetical protein [Acinetobacter lwoffii]MCU4616731.1 hypothetical protein [Acinetobacter lwoffii]